MKHIFNLYHRHSIRLKGFDYAMNGMFYITLCIQNHECLLGNIINGEMIYNHAGKMFNSWWQKIPEKFPGIELDEFIIMPNHFHAIVINDRTIVGADPCVCPDISQHDIKQHDIKQHDISQHDIKQHDISQHDIKQHDIKQHDIKQHDIKQHDIAQFNFIEGEHMGSPLHRVVQWFKTMTTNEYIRNVKSNGWQPFDRKLWQRNYYEHIIRDKKSYHRIKKYIIENPLNWRQ